MWAGRRSGKDQNELTATSGGSGDAQGEQLGQGPRGRAKEAAGSLSGDKDKKAEGRSDQREGTAKEKSGAAKDLAQ